MSTATTTETALSTTLGSKLRKTLIGAGFAVILLIPKVLNLRRNEHSWVIFRTVMGFFGAALVVLPIGFFSSYFLAVVGLAIFIAAILLPPVKATSTIDDKALELGASIVVNGGLLQSNGDSSIPVQLFVGSDNLWALNSDFYPVLVISVPRTNLRARRRVSKWLDPARSLDRPQRHVLLFRRFRGASRARRRKHRAKRHASFLASVAAKPRRQRLKIHLNFSNVQSRKISSCGTFCVKISIWPEDGKAKT